MRAFVMGVVFLSGLAVGMAFRTGDASAQWSDQEPMRLLKDGGVVPFPSCGFATPARGEYQARHQCPTYPAIRVDAQGYVICSAAGGVK